MPNLKARLEALERGRATKLKPPEAMFWETADGAGGYVLFLETGIQITGDAARRWIDENGTAEGCQ